MSDFGQKLEAFGDGLSQTNLNLPVSTTNTKSNSGDIGANTSPQSVRVDCEFDIQQTGSTDTADIEIFVQHSDDDTNWPDDDQGSPIFSWRGGSAGDDLDQSEPVSFTPKARYYRFRCVNNNANDAVDLDIATAHQLEQSV